MCVLSHISHVWLFVTPWIIACQASLSMGLSRQVNWSGLPCPAPGDLPNSGIKPTSLMSPALASGFFTASATWEDQTGYYEFTLNFKRHRQSFPGHRGKKPVCCRTRDEEEFVWEERKSFTKHPVMPGSILHVLLFNKLLCHSFRVQKHFVRFHTMQTQPAL